MGLRVPSQGRWLVDARRTVPARLSTGGREVVRPEGGSG